MNVNGTMATRWTSVIRTVGVSLALGLLLVLGAASPHAEETQPATPTDSTLGPVEGLRVHGHWTIEVRDPDGTLVERREFENALAIPTGAGHLASVLGRASTVGGWRITTNGTVEICEEPVGTPAGCEMVESSDGLISNAVFPTLTVGVSGSQELVLNGSLVAQADGNVNRVRTFNLSCSSATSPDSCPGGVVTGADTVTDTTLGAPIAVLTGQQVQVNVTISFS